MNVLSLEPLDSWLHGPSVRVLVDGEPLYRSDAFGPPLRELRQVMWGHQPEDGYWADLESFDDGRVPLAACGCGLPDCDSLIARIQVEADVVTWSDLDQYRNWEGAGERDGAIPTSPLRFDRSQYEGEITRVLDEFDAS